VLDIQAKIRKTGTVLGKEFARRVGPDAPASMAGTVASAEAVVAPGDFLNSTRLRSEKSNHG
jgi:hypothetical protein